jgi:hypothetical protein
MASYCCAVLAKQGGSYSQSFKKLRLLAGINSKKS